MNRITITSLWAWGTFALILAAPLEADILSLAPPRLTPYDGQDIGDTQIGVSFTALATYTISAAGIKFNPFGNQTSQPKTYELDVYIYAVTGGTRGPLLANGSLCRGGPCPQTNLFPSNGNPGTPVFFDVPVNFTFTAGQTYLVEFGVQPDGWGEGPTAKNSVEFYRFDPSFPNDPPSESGVPFTVGPAQVLDGWFGADATNQNFPHIRMTTSLDTSGLFKLQFITQDTGNNNALIPQTFSYNSVPCPVIQATASNLSIDSQSNAAVTVTGTVIDQASGLVYDPGSQIQTLNITLGGTTLATVPLINSGSPSPPWQPYAYSASFSTQVKFLVPGFGDYPIELTTPLNVAGCGGNVSLTLHTDVGVADISPDATPGPGTFLPTLLRFPAPTDIAPNLQIRAFSRNWNIKQMNFGDGEYWYAVDPMGNATVFLPAAYAQSFIQTMPITIEFTARIVDRALVVDQDKINIVNGLIVDNDDVTAILGKITNYTKLQLMQGNKNIFVYLKKRAQNLGHADNTVNTEILWRYIGTEKTVARFSSANELNNDIAYRLNVVNAANGWRVKFGSPSMYNKAFWATDVQVVNGKTADAAIGDIFATPASYTYACALSSLYITEGAAIPVLTAATFNGKVGLFPYGNRENVLVYRDQQPNATPAKPDGDNSHPNNAHWIPGDAGFIKNTAPNSKTLIIAGENVIYIGGSFDLDLPTFMKTANFWGAIDTTGANKNIFSFGTWIANVTSFGDPECAKMGKPNGCYPSLIRPRRITLKQ